MYLFFFILNYIAACGYDKYRKRKIGWKFNVFFALIGVLTSTLVHRVLFE